MRRLKKMRNETGPGIKILQASDEKADRNPLKNKKGEMKMTI